ncbi:MAG: diguanylate cyclase [Pseudomonadota bacterium]
MGDFTRNVFLSLLLVSAPALALGQVNDPSFEQVELLLDSDARRALSLSLQLRDTAQKTGLPGPLVDVLGLVMRAQNAVGNHVEALNTGQEALQVARSAGDPGRQSDIHRRMAGIYVDRNDYRNAERHLEPALTLATSAEDLLRRAHGLALLGRVRRYQVRYQDALELMDAAMAIYQRLENMDGVAGQISNRGVVLELMGQFEPALEAHMQALELAQLTNDLSASATALYNLGEIHRELGDHELSLSYLQDALALDQQVGNLTDIAYSHNMLGQALLEAGDIDSARQQAQKAVKLFDQLDAPRDRAWAKTILAKVELTAGNLPEARVLLDQALATAIERESWSLLPKIRMRRVTLEIADGNFAEAEAQALLGIEMTRGNGESDREEELTGLLAEAREAAGDLPGALAAIKRQRQLKSEILRSDRQQNLAAMQSQAEFLRRGQRIELLEANQTLQQERMAREVLLRKVWVAGVFILLVVLALSYARVSQLRSNRRLSREVANRTQELESAYAAVEEASLTDALTGLRNRRFLEQLAPHSHAGSAGLVVMLLDLDHFKNINDSQGHEAGDGVLVQVAERLRDELGSTDTIVRWGGEEFLVACSVEASGDGALRAEKLRQKIASNLFLIEGGGALRVTCSAGFVELPLTGDETADLRWIDLLNLADSCLYAAKASGRNAWVGMRASALAEATLRTELRRPVTELAESAHWELESSLGSRAKLRWG